MKPGNIFTIEPIFTMYPNDDFHFWKDKWAITSSNNPSGKKLKYHNKNLFI